MVPETWIIICTKINLLFFIDIAIIFLNHLEVETCKTAGRTWSGYHHLLLGLFVIIESSIGLKGFYID